MSINVTSAGAFSKLGEESPARIFTFRSLIETLSALRSAPALAEVND